MNDRAAVVTTAITQMIATAPRGELRPYLREEFEDAARQLAAEVRAAFAARNSS